ncbi:GGDEF domain-containing protein [Aquitalea palustris]|uniref:GGDEF domain-containing protein n=1 Tax=Aquitalea palustris TaxID=2480983 RepID=UPI0018F3409A|nr:GGDEF domain-containing protein [Aquitalea palustris]
MFNTASDQPLALSGRWRVDIPKALWPEFEAYIWQHHRGFLLLTNIIAALAFFSYVLADALLIPDMAQASLLLRSVLLLVAMLDIWLVFGRRRRNILLLDQLMPLHDLIATVAWFELLKRSHSPDVPTFLYASLIFIVFANLGVRVSFKGALASSLAISLVIIGNVALMNPHDSKPLLVFSLVYLPVLLFCLFMSWNTTSSVRLAFYASQEEARRKNELSSLNRRLQMLASTDALTQVGNRRAFDLQLEQLWLQMSQHGRPFALLLVDIDFFKPYNDHYGHLAGDHVLAEVASAMVNSLRSGQARAFRYGGEEFAILLQSGRQDELRRIGQRLLQQVAALQVEHHHRPDGPPHLTISVGAALSSLPGLRDATDLLACCDRMLYRAKQQGRNQLQLATDDMVAGRD